MKEIIQRAIKSRRSIREFTDEPVTMQQLHKIMEAGVWAPSGLNNQPWRFVTVTSREIRGKLAELTHYSHIVQAAPALIVVYLDKDAMYDAVKDYQSAGACIQNMLLAVEELGLGAVWLGQILKNKEKVNVVLGLEQRFDLMAVLAVGWPLHRKQRSRRKPLDEFIIKEFGDH